jgi:hypothetical protein
MMFVSCGICTRICFGFCPAICPEICHAIKNITKIMVSLNFCQTHFLEVGLTQILVDHAPLSIVCHVGRLGIRGTQVKSSIQDIVDEVAPIKKAPLWG